MTLHDTSLRGFASDNYAGVHPEILHALAAANGGHQIAYGEDVYTARLLEVFEDHFGTGIEVFPVFNGTGANVVGLQSMLPRWGAVVCASTAHINTDENAAPERVAGIKLLTVDTPDGKLTPELIDKQAWGWGDEHRAQPLVVSITQSTELGTVYTAAEVRAIADHAHARGMHLHMDGARIANAAASLGVPFREFTRDAGVDVLSFGGTKNGLLFGEAIVAFTPAAVEGLIYLRKLDMQLASKMRFLSAQLIALFETTDAGAPASVTASAPSGEPLPSADPLWLRSAGHANAMAARLRSAIEDRLASGAVTGVSFTQATQANAVFAILPAGVADRLRAAYRFYDWNPETGEVRWVCSFDTTEDDIDSFVAALERELAA